jgi:hypothetical protein
VMGDSDLAGHDAGFLGEWFLMLQINKLLSQVKVYEICSKQVTQQEYVGRVWPVNLLDGKVRQPITVQVQIYIAERRGYVLRNVLLGNSVIVQASECTYTNVGSIAYYTPSLHTAYCS